MVAGQLRDRVAFQKKVSVSDGGGGSTTSWQTQFTVWGGFRPERGRERLEAGRLESAVAGVLKVRSSVQARTVDASWRVLIDSVAYQVRSITNPDRRDRFLEMTIERGVGT